VKAYWIMREDLEGPVKLRAPSGLGLALSLAVWVWALTLGFVWGGRRVGLGERKSTPTGAVFSYSSGERRVTVV
jgi:hypothetical protein